MIHLLLYVCLELSYCLLFAHIQGPPNTFFRKMLKKNYWIFSQISFFYLKVQSFQLIMENNFIQMAASAGHVVAYTIGSIFKHMCSCISPMASQILSFVNCLWLVDATLIFDGTLQIMVQRCQIAAPMWPNDISSAADNAIFKNRAQYIECSFGCVAHSAVLLKPNVANILLFNFCEQKFFQHGPIRIAIDSFSPCSFSKKNFPIMPLDQNPHQRVTRFGCVGFSIYACGCSVPQMRQFCLFT